MVFGLSLYYVCIFERPRLHLLVKCKSNRFEAGYLVTPCFKPVAANLQLIPTLGENKELTVLGGGRGDSVGVMFGACMCVHMHKSEMSHHSGAAAGFIQLAIE